MGSRRGITCIIPCRWTTKPSNPRTRPAWSSAKTGTWGCAQVRVVFGRALPTLRRMLSVDSSSCLRHPAATRPSLAGCRVRETVRGSKRPGRIERAHRHAATPRRTYLEPTVAFAARIGIEASRYGRWEPATGACLNALGRRGRPRPPTPRCRGTNRPSRGCLSRKCASGTIRALVRSSTRRSRSGGRGRAGP